VISPNNVSRPGFYVEQKDQLMMKAIFTATVAFAAATSAPAQTRIAAATPTKPAAAAAITQQVQLPSPETMVILIRTSLIALSQANQTNNYSVLSSLGSTGFRAANPPARLASIFEPFRVNRIDLAPVTFVQPQLTQPARIEGGKLRMIGIFPTQPMQVNYDLTFEPSSGVWQLQGLSINLQLVQQPPAQPQR
jgi:hypothetical protein